MHYVHLGIFRLLDKSDVNYFEISKISLRKLRRCMVADRIMPISILLRMEYVNQS